MFRALKRIKKIIFKHGNRILNRIYGSLDSRSIEVVLYENTIKHLRPNKKIILYVAMKYDYGNKEWGLSYEHYNFYYTLLNMGYSVIYFDCDRIKQKYGSKKMSQMLREAAYQYQPDFLFYSLAYDWIDHSVWREISNELPIKTIIWLTDDHVQYEETRSIWKLFNIIITTDKNSYKKRKKEGFDNVFLSQWACNDSLYKNLNLKRIYDITFVGRCYGERQNFIKKLKGEGINIKTFGQGWENDRRISQAELVRIFNQSKISLNLSLSYNSIYTVKGRDFEAPGCGSLLLTLDSREIREFFTPRKEIITYTNINDAVKKIKYYLKNSEERENIAKAGYCRILRDHTYSKRFSEIIKFSEVVEKKNHENLFFGRS